MNTLKTLTAAIALASLGAAAPAVLAQGAAGGQAQGAAGGQAQGAEAQQGTMGGAQQQAQISNDDLEKFASADEKVSEIRDEFSERLSQADNQEEAQSLQLEAQEKMVEAVQSEGLEIPKYNEIATRMQTDPELQQRVQSMN